MSFLNSLDITGSALTAERFRMDVISENLANIDTTMTPEGTPYRRQQVVFRENGLDFGNVLQNARANYYGTPLHNELCLNQGAVIKKGTSYQLGSGGVQVEKVVGSKDDFVPVYDPSHPDADEEGYVWRPNVDRAEEMIDMMAASTAYNANMTALGVIKSMTMKALDIGR